MLIGLGAVGVALLAIGGGLVAAFARQRSGSEERVSQPDLDRVERWQTRESKFKSRLATLEDAIAKTESRLAERKSELARSDPDRWLRTFFETEHPALLDAATTDVSKVEWLRHWVYRNIPHGKYGQDLDPIAFDIIHKPVAEVLRELNEQRSGLLCAGMAWVLYRLYDIFGFAACTMDLGGPDHGTDSHMVTVVELPGAFGPVWSVQDPYFDYMLEDRHGQPLDVRRAMHLLSLGKTEWVCVRDTKTPKLILVGPTADAARERLDAAGAPELPRYGVHQRFLHPHSPSVFRAWHPEILHEIRERLGQADVRLLFLVPQHTHGDRRFRVLLPLAAQKLRRYRERIEPLHLIYSIGKTGTQTIERSLKAAGVRGPVCRTHILSPAAIREYSSAAGRDPSPSQASHEAQAVEARGIRRLLARQRSLRRRVPGLSPIRVICGVREPVAQLLSRVFQDPQRYLGSLDRLTPEHVSAWLEELALDTSTGARAHGLYFTDWFDDELRAVLGVDVYDTPFPCERGWQVHETLEARVLVYRQEGLNELGPVLADFAGVARLDLVNANRRTDTPLAELYQRCRRDCRVSTALLDVLYGSRYAQHFYSPREIERFRAQWQPHDLRVAASTAEP